jgi:starch synthase
MRRGIRHADIVNTVSERYAREILTSAFGQGLDPDLRARRPDVFGIINGIDAEVYNPATDAHLPYNYKWWDIEGKRQSKRALQRRLGLAERSDLPLIGMVNRLTHQKGTALLMQTLPELLKRDVQLVIAGDGDRVYAETLRAVERQHPDRLALVMPFSEETASHVYAAANLYLMPSRFEPCGISQLIGLRYGAIPVVHRTGGLADTVTEFDAAQGTGNGFIFTSYAVPAFLAAVDRALAIYRDQATWVPLTMRAMRAVYSWELPARKYLELFRLAVRRRQKRV